MISPGESVGWFWRERGGSSGEGCSESNTGDEGERSALTHNEGEIPGHVNSGSHDIKHVNRGGSHNNKHVNRN